MNTGKPQLKNDELTSFNVKGGEVRLGSCELDNSKSNYTNIIAGKARIEGKIYSKKAINIRTKNSDLNHYSVDVSELVGMYADQIYLVDKRQGLGVKNVGEIGRDVGKIIINSQGRIVNQGSIAGKNVTLKIKQEIVKHKNYKKNSKQSVTVATNQAKLQNQKLINREVVDGKQTVVKAQKVKNLGTGKIYGDKVAINTKNLTNGKALYEYLNAYTKVNLIENLSATIEDQGDGVINTNQLLNQDIHLKIKNVETFEKLHIYHLFNFS